LPLKCEVDAPLGDWRRPSSCHCVHVILSFARACTSPLVEPCWNGCYTTSG